MLGEIWPWVFHLKADGDTEIHHNPTEFSDMLSIYIYTGRSPQQRGTVVRRNYFHDVNSK
jgi:hypothetical protein